jgi:hypothetical protein
MTVLELIDEATRQVPASAPPGTCWKAAAEIATPHGRHTVVIEARIEADGQRHEAFRFDDSRIERHVLLRLTCSETECPQAVAVRAQWIALHTPGPTEVRVQGPCPRPLITEVAVGGDGQHIVARPARFPCFTPCPHGAHLPLTIDKSGFDLFEDGVCLGGGLTVQHGVLQPRIPTLRAAEAFVLARRLETLVTLGKAAESSRLARGSTGGTD